MIEFNITGIDGVIETLERLPPEVVSKRGGPVLGAVRKGMNVITKQARVNFRRAVAFPGLTGITETTGFTEKNIIARRAKMIAGEKGERMVVTIRSKTHPSGKTYRDRPVKTNDVAYFMEVGSSTQPSIPWMRPAYYMKREEAVNVTITELKKRVDKIVQKLAAQNRGK